MATLKGPRACLAGCVVFGAWARVQGTNRTPATRNMNIFKELILPLGIPEEGKKKHFRLLGLSFKANMNSLARQKLAILVPSEKIPRSLHLY
jgi:hypothetical protein